MSLLKNWRWWVTLMPAMMLTAVWIPFWALWGAGKAASWAFLGIGEAASYVCDFIHYRVIHPMMKWTWQLEAEDSA